MGLGVRVGVRLRVSRWSIRGRGSQTTWFASTPRANLCSWPRSNGVCTIVASMAAVAAMGPAGGGGALPRHARGAPHAHGTPPSCDAMAERMAACLGLGLGLGVGAGVRVRVRVGVGVGVRVTVEGRVVVRVRLQVWAKVGRADGRLFTLLLWQRLRWLY